MTDEITISAAHGAMTTDGVSTWRSFDVSHPAIGSRRIRAMIGEDTDVMDDAAVMADLWREIYAAEREEVPE